MTMRTRQTSAEWGATVVAPITAKDALAKIQSAIDYADDAINEVMSTIGGTAPPPRALMPDLYTARDKASNARGAIQSVVDRVPDAEIGAMYVTEGKRLGMELIDAANEAVDKSKRGESVAHVAEEVAKAGVNVASKAAGGILSLAGRALTPFEIAFGLILVDEIFNQGKVRRRLLKG